MGRSFPKSLCEAPDSQEDSYLQGVYSLSPPHRALSKVRDTVLADGQREALSLSLCGVPWVSVLWILHLFPCFMVSIPFHPKGVWLQSGSSSQPSACWGGTSVLPPEHSEFMSLSMTPSPLGDDFHWGRGTLQHLDETSESNSLGSCLTSCQLPPNTPRSVSFQMCVFYWVSLIIF